jgi:hypothetical protein
MQRHKTGVLCVLPRCGLCVKKINISTRRTQCFSQRTQEEMSAYGRFMVYIQNTGRKKADATKRRPPAFSSIGNRPFQTAENL